MPQVTFYHGSKSKFFMNGRDVSAQFRSMRGGINVDQGDISTWGESWKKYLTGMQDASGTAEGIYDGAASRIDMIIEEVMAASAPAVMTWVLNQDLPGRVAWGMEGDVSSYEVKAGMGDAATFTMETKPNAQQTPVGGWERGLILWAGSQISGGSTQSTGQSYSGCSTYGGHFYVQILSTTGSCRIALQDSGDNSTFTDLLTASYASTASGTGYRYTASGSVRTYVRVSACPSQTPAGSLTYHAMFGRKYFSV